MVWSRESMPACVRRSPLDAIRIGCAGWALRREDVDAFPPPGTHLARYAARFNAAEINSSFYRPHRRTTYERWAASVPGDFAFAVKVPRAITHTLRLKRSEAALEDFLAEVSGLGAKLGPLLLQLPPSLELAPPTLHQTAQRAIGIGREKPDDVLVQWKHLDLERSRREPNGDFVPSQRSQAHRQRILAGQAGGRAV